jgi:tight adherence protein B
MTVLVVVLVVVAVCVWPRRGPVLLRGLAGQRRLAEARGARGPGLGRPALLARVRAVWRRELRFGRVRRGWVCDFAELSAVGLDAGLPAAEAARLACDVGGSGASGPQIAALGERVAAARARGGSVGECLREAAEADPDLAFLAAAWQLADEFGVATAPAARASAAVLRERAASDDRRTVLAAGPRASMWLLTLLPLSGPLVGLVLGLPVTEVYGSDVSLVAAGCGLCLTALGWFWSRTVLRRALRPAEVT